MKRIIAMTAAALVLMGAMAACTGTADAPETTTETTTEAATEETTETLVTVQRLEATAETTTEAETTQKETQAETTAKSGSGSSGNKAATTTKPASGSGSKTTTTTKAASGGSGSGSGSGGSSSSGTNSINTSEVTSTINAYIKSKGVTVDTTLRPKNSGWSLQFPIEVYTQSKLISELKEMVVREANAGYLWMYCYYDSGEQYFYILKT